MNYIPHILFTVSGIFVCGVLVYGYRHVVRRKIVPDIEPIRVMLGKTVSTSSKYAHSHFRLVIIHAAEQVSHFVHALTHAIHTGSRAIIRSSFFPHKQVDNHESLLKALIEEKQTIRDTIDKLNDDQLNK